MYQNVGVAYFFSLCNLVDDDSASCPPIRHFLSSSLQSLGDGVITGNRDQCLPLLRTLLENPVRFEFISSFFSPRYSPACDYTMMYKLICEMPASDNHQQFVLLTKMALPEWMLAQDHSLKDRSFLISQIGLTLKGIGGNNVPEDREMVHGTIKAHLMAIAELHFEDHYNEVSTLNYYQ